MSAICGIISLTGKPVLTHDLEIMLSTLSRHGPDGTNMWIAGPVGFGHQMMHVTPESLVETLPFYDSATGLTITADARLDNRDDLFQKLDISPTERAIHADSNLVLK